MEFASQFSKFFLQQRMNVKKEPALSENNDKDPFDGDKRNTVDEREPPFAGTGTEEASNSKAGGNGCFGKQRK